LGVEKGMRTLESIHREIDELSERRVELWRDLSEGYEASLQAEVHRLEERLEELWQEQRQLRAEMRWGDRQRIIARARAEERLERHAA
jgi:ABC-type phosphate transport system auxiliary subunit